MTVTITFGYWLIPTFITVLAFVTAWWYSRPTPRYSRDYVGALIDLIFYGAATIVSLIAWLVWAVLT